MKNGRIFECSRALWYLDLLIRFAVPDVLLVSAAYPFLSPTAHSPSLIPICPSLALSHSHLLSHSLSSLLILFPHAFLLSLFHFLFPSFLPTSSTITTVNINSISGTIVWPCHPIFCAVAPLRCNGFASSLLVLMLVIFSSPFANWP